MSVPLPSSARQRTARSRTPLASAPPSSVPLSLPPSSRTAACHGVRGAALGGERAVHETQRQNEQQHQHRDRPAERLQQQTAGASALREAAAARRCPAAPGGSLPGGGAGGWAETSVVMRGSGKRRFPSEGDPKRQIRPHASVADAVGHVDVDGADRAAPARADAHARIKHSFAPVSVAVPTSKNAAAPQSCVNQC